MQGAVVGGRRSLTLSLQCHLRIDIQGSWKARVGEAVATRGRGREDPVDAEGREAVEAEAETVQEREAGTLDQLEAVEWGETVGGGRAELFEQGETVQEREAEPLDQREKTVE